METISFLACFTPDLYLHVEFYLWLCLLSSLIAGRDEFRQASRWVIQEWGRL